MQIIYGGGGRGRGGHSQWRGGENLEVFFQLRARFSFLLNVDSLRGVRVTPQIMINSFRFHNPQNTKLKIITSSIFHNFEIICVSSETSMHASAPWECAARDSNTDSLGT